MNHRTLFALSGLAVAVAGCGGGGTPSSDTVPNTPTSLVAALAGTSANLNWTDNADNESATEIERFTSTGGWAVVLEAPANATTASVSGLEPGATFAFRVRARNSAGKSGFSNEVPLTVAELTQPNRNPVAPYSPNFLGDLTSKGKWNATTITYSIDKGADSRTLATLQALLAKSAARWNTATNGLITLNRVDSGANIQIAFAAASDPDFSDGTVGVTVHTDIVPSPTANRTVFSSVTMKVKAEIPDGQLVPLATHELGHALGIGGHSSDSGDTMFGVVTATTLISARDANTLAKLYLTTE